MKKTIIIIMALLFSMVIGSAAFAGEGQTIYFDNLKSVSYGTHGHIWSGDIDSRALPADLKIYNRLKYGDRYGYYNNVADVRYHGDYDRDGQWHFYKDARGVLHYIYLDPDRDYEWQSYKDQNGVTQYYVRDIGWK
ncbi:hypothetical protein DCCM_3972 [Desulfocucumis palustris]|uniref:Uncharacterized protein n=1 Tax=Desulfocucumis palustris TaxID=1898651 RepID=A0A2L2XFE7_9FIRM|nr:hypothetical protein [Desulfocucumis palustris]GBF34852.1 hypothetical protein DCCM_3972 [Desulfocucumis palustris]